MSAYVGKLLTAVSAALEFNSATLSGAIDIIVIEDDKGSRHCSPFYVRFGKLQLLKSRGIPVDIVLNDNKTDLRMYLGAAGEAYFYDQLLADKLQTTSGENPFSRSNTNDGKDCGSHNNHASASDMPRPNNNSSGNLSESTDGQKGATTPTSYPVSPATLLEHDGNDGESHARSPCKPKAVPPFSSPATPTSEIDNDVQFYTRAIRSTSDIGFQSFGYLSDSEMELTRLERDGTTEVVDEPRSPPITDSQRRWSSQWARNRSMLHQRSSMGPSSKHRGYRNSRRKPDLIDSQNVLHEVPQADDSEPPAIAVEDQLSSLFGLPESGSVDVEVNQEDEQKRENSKVSSVSHSNQRLHCGERNAVLHHSSNGFSRSLEGTNTSRLISVSDANAEVDLDEENKLELRSIDGCDERDDLVELGIEEKLAKALSTEDNKRHPESIVSENVLVMEHQEDADEEGVIEMSLCAKSIRSDMGEADMMAVFNEYRVSHSQFEADPNILYDEDLMFRIEDQLVTLKVAVPFVMAMLAFKTPMDIDLLSRKVTGPVEEKPPKAATSPTSSRRFSWFGWSSPPVTGEPLLAEEDFDDIPPDAQEERVEADRNIEIHSKEKTTDQNDLILAEDEPHDTGLLKEDPGVDKNVKFVGPFGTAAKASPARQSDVEASSSNGDMDQGLLTQTSEESIFSEADYESECFSFLPSSQQLADLDLKPGANEIRFVISSRSACELRCRIFLWRNDSKIVISDVDGTITRSDVLGHLLPAVGRDWSQVGVAGLYSQIAKNGYKMLYLTARPIGQAAQTRDFLHNVTQGTARLPNGPVLMSPNRLVESFTREVILRKPHEFKIACLRDIRCLFPPTYNPFHAGFGNRDTDVISYRAVGLIPQRIFVVNPRGEIVVMKATFESTASYSSLRALVENVFPDITGKSGQEWVRHATETATYNDWNYWRASPLDIDLDALVSSPDPQGK